MTTSVSMVENDSNCKSSLKGLSLYQSRHTTTTKVFAEDGLFLIVECLVHTHLYKIRKWNFTKSKNGGCPLCVNYQRKIKSNNYHSTTLSRRGLNWLSQAKHIFPFFNYDKVKYVNSHTKVIIICQLHGNVEVNPTDFIRSKHGCPECAIAKNIEILKENGTYYDNGARLNSILDKNKRSKNVEAALSSRIKNKTMVPPDQWGEWLSYKRLVQTLTRKNEKTVKNINLRGRKHGYALDHIFSILDGFFNGGPPDIVADTKNLHIITSTENSKKGTKSDITLNELLLRIKGKNNDNME